MDARSLEFSGGRILTVYGVVVAVPFVLFVVGWDLKRWEGNYWFSDAGKADTREMWTRWAAYFPGGLLGYAFA